MGLTKIALPVAVLGVVLASAPVAGADVVVKQEFEVDSGDTCGVTKGVFAWYVTPKIDVTGVLHDTPCKNDGRFSEATFTAYAGGRAVDKEVIKADDGPTDFVFQLDNSVSLAAIERVTVRVCRDRDSVGIPGYCGPTQEFLSPR